MYNGNSSDFANGFIAGQNGSNNCNSNGMGWGGDWFWGIILIALLFNRGGLGNDFGGGNYGGGANFIPYAVGSSYTDSAIQRGFDTQSIVGKLDGISNGICDSTFALNNTVVNGFNNVSSAICNLGYENAQLANATNVAIMQGNNAIQTQLSDCCCRTQTAIAGVENSITGLGCTLGREIERGFCDVNYNMATNTNAIQVQMANNTRDIIDSQNAGTRAILDYLCQEKISDLQNENQSLRLAASQANQNNVIRAAIDASTAEIIRRTGNDCPIPAYVVPNPNCCYGPFGNGYGYGYGFNGYNNGCGCNSGSGCGC